MSIPDSAIICIHIEQFIKTDSNEHNDNVEDETLDDFENMMNPVVTSFVFNLCYTDNFGKNVKQIEKFKDLTVNSFRILKSYIYCCHYTRGYT